MIDLHCHSTASDGEYTPSQLVEMAVKTGLSAIALTDHDTTDGLDEFLQTASKYGIEGIPGVELSCLTASRFQIHMVGLFINYKNEVFQNILEQIRIWREERNVKMIEKLAELGMPLDVEYVKEIALENTSGEIKDFMGRPHIAEALVRKGYCKDKKEAFVKYLGKNAPAYMTRRTLDADKGIAAIHAAGGIAVFAHSLTSISDSRKHQSVVEELKNIGIDGIEVMYSEYSALAMRKMNGLANAKNLLKSGGTDFHGPSTSAGIFVGTGRSHDGSFVIPDEFLDDMKAYMKSLKKI